MDQQSTVKCLETLTGVTPTSSSVAAGRSVSVRATTTATCAEPILASPRWESSDAAIATVAAAADSPKDVQVTGVAPGVATIKATSLGVTSSATVTVTAPAVARITVTTPSPSLLVNATLLATATAFDEGSDPLPNATLAWSSSNASVATVSPSTGLVTGVAPGAVTISALSGSVSGSVELSVVAPPPAAVNSVIVSGPTLLLLGQSTAQFTATAFDADKNVLTGRAISWSSANVPASVNVASVDATGLVTTLSVGAIDLTATSEGKSGTIRVPVRLPAHASIVITPPTSTLQAGQSVQLTASARSGSTSIGSPQATDFAWRSLSPQIASVSASGLVTAVQAGGPVTIEAKLDDVTGSATITVPSPIATGRFAYALVDNPTAASYTANPTYAYNSTGGPITITRVSPGNYKVRFAGQETPPGASETILVTPHGAFGHANGHPARSSRGKTYPESDSTLLSSVTYTSVG